MLKVLMAIGGAQLLAMIVLLARTKALALLLGPESVGILAVTDKLIAVFVQTASLSLPFAAIRFLPKLWEQDRSLFFVRLRSMTVVLTAAAVLAAAIGLAITALGPAWLGATLLSFRPVIALAFVTAPVVALVPFLQNAAAAGLAPQRSVGLMVGHAVLFTVTGIAGALWAGLAGVYAAYGVAGGIFVAVAAIRLNRSPIAAAPPRFALRDLKLPGEIWRFGVALLTLTFLAPYAALYVHYRVLSDSGAVSAGWMQAAIGISLAVRAVLGSAHPIFLTPQVNRAGTPADRMAWADNFEKTLSCLIVLVVPPLVLFPGLAVRALYSQAFTPAAVFVSLFVLAEILGLLAATYQALVLAFDRLAYHVTQNVVAQMLMIAVAVVAIPKVGIAGAALGAACAQVFLLMSTTVFLQRKFGLHPSPRTLSLIFYVVAVLCVAGLLGRGEITTFPVVAWRLGIYAASAAGLVLFLDSDDREKLRRVLRTRRFLVVGQPS